MPRRRPKFPPPAVIILFILFFGFIASGSYEQMVEDAIVQFVERAVGVDRH